MNLESYTKLWTDRIAKQNLDYAHAYDNSHNTTKKALALGAYGIRGGGQERKYPMVGTDENTYSPSTNAVSRVIGVGGKKKNHNQGITNQNVMDFGKGFHDGFVGTAKMFGEAAEAIAPAAMLAAGKPKPLSKELDQAKESLKKFVQGERKLKPSKKHIALLEAHGIISRKGADAEVEGGKISRIKKAQRWESFAKDAAHDALDLGSKGKSIFGSAKKPPSPWIGFVKTYASKHGITYKEALSKAGPAYKQLNGVSGGYHPAV
jgi:hypothetical protein